MKKLYKQASDELNKALLEKLAGGVTDSLTPTTVPTSYLNIHPYSLISRIIAGSGDAPTKEEIEEYDKHPIRGLFNSPYRDIRRRREILARAGKDAGSHVAAEEIAAPGLVLGALLGGGALASYMDRDDKKHDAAREARRMAEGTVAAANPSPKFPKYGPNYIEDRRAYYRAKDQREEAIGKAGREAYAAAEEAHDASHRGRRIGEAIAGGVGLAAIAAELAAPIVAAITPTRTAEEQLKHDKGSAWKSWLIPGVASYNRWKRLGRIIAEDAEREAPQKKTASALTKLAEDLKSGVSGIVTHTREGLPNNPYGLAVQNDQFVKTTNGPSYLESLDRHDDDTLLPNAADALTEDEKRRFGKDIVPITPKHLGRIRAAQSTRVADAIAEKNPTAYFNLLRPTTWGKGLPWKNEYLTEVSRRLREKGEANEQSWRNPGKAPVKTIKPPTTIPAKNVPLDKKTQQDIDELGGSIAANNRRNPRGVGLPA